MIITPTGATRAMPSSIILPSSGPAPASSPAMVGMRTRATSTDMRLVMMANRNIAIVAKPKMASMLPPRPPFSKGRSMGKQSSMTKDGGNLYIHNICA